MAFNSGYVAVSLLLLVAVVWLYRINRAMKTVPAMARELSHHWSNEELTATYERVKETPISLAGRLPPKLDRRYIIIGGSGHVGGDVVMQLLERGQTPEGIRIVDCRPPNRPEMLHGSGSRCDFVQADVTSSISVQDAFSRPWHGAVAGLPLTVFHTAATIRPHERSKLLYDRCRRVNVVGTATVLDAARSAGADILVFTSSASVSIEPVKFWIWPWESEPGRWFQYYDESDYATGLRRHEDYFGNYAVSKAEAERLVCGANDDGFRTGALRPGSTIYGRDGDQVVSKLLQEETVITWIPHMVQNFIHGRNVALAHLQLEAALARPLMPPCAGKPFNISDPNPPMPFGNLYDAAKRLSGAPVKYVYLQPVVPLLLAHVIEAWCLLLAYMPFLTKLGLREPGPPTVLLQPSIFSAAAHVIVDDSAARKSVEEGGFGYVAAYTTMEGICEQILDWKRSRGFSRGDEGR